MPQDDLVTASRFCESRVQNHGNELLGYVEDVVLHPLRGQITHVIMSLSKGNVLDKTRRILVPWSALQPLYNDQALLLQASAEEVASYPDAPFDLVHRGLWTGAPRGQGASASFEL